ncbi:hypothetical protein [Candidatus Merdisoma sp. JLR.KK006]|uniref:hypothetical protein n=1 Tax=Candidatus Merdisoma sp. JLR.KK006 TaxID=3112626 RepID=UPI002FEFBF30
MKYADKMEFSNIQLYEVSDMQIENLVLKAARTGAGVVVVGPSGVPVVSRVLTAEDRILVDCALSYPSGAYLTEQKVQEIEDVLEELPQINELYIVMQVGTYLSGHKDIMKEELVSLVKSAKGVPVKIVTEISAFSKEQMKEVCDAAATAGAKGIVISADFAPYDIPEPDIEQVKEFVEAAAGRFEVIGAGGVTDAKRFLAMLDAGVTRVNTPAAYEILMELNKKI